MYTAATLEMGIGAVFAFPIQIGGSRLGVLDVYRDQPGVLTGEQVGHAVTLADVALVMILDGQHVAPPERSRVVLIRHPAFRPKSHRRKV
jgi:hypothetical protein